MRVDLVDEVYNERKKQIEKQKQKEAGKQSVWNVDKTTFIYLHLLFCCSSRAYPIPIYIYWYERNKIDDIKFVKIVVMHATEFL